MPTTCSPAPSKSVAPTDERRSWHYPPAWEGVAWQPAPAPLLDSAAAAYAGLLLLTRAAGWAAALGAVLTTVATAAAMIGGS